MSEARDREGDRGPAARTASRAAGEGQREAVGGSGVYPASSGKWPQDAEVRTPGEWGEGAGGEEGGRSELRLSDEELRARKDQVQDEQS